MRGAGRNALMSHRKDILRRNENENDVIDCIQIELSYVPCPFPSSMYSDLRKSLDETLSR